MDILYMDEHILLCVKPPRVLSTDEPGGLPSLLRAQLGDPCADIRTVHRLDRVVSGLIVLARNAPAASELSRQIREGEFEKEYLAVVHGCPPPEDRLTDLLQRDKARKMTFVTTEPCKDARSAALRYSRLHTDGTLSRLRIQLETGRTHQIRVQFSSRGWPLVGERKYAQLDDPCELALWSCRLAFRHPVTGEQMAFYSDPPGDYPWSAV